MISTLLNLVLFIVMLGVLVTIHELGHFLVAKMFKVYVFEFSIGFGPKIFRKKKGETFYSLRALPLGGYVALLGEEDTIPEDFKDHDIDMSRSLGGINRGKRALIMSAGIIMNLVLGYAIFFFSNGVLTQTGMSSSLKVTEGSYIETVGVESGDRLVFETEIEQFPNQTLQYFGIGTVSTEPAQTQFYVLFQPTSFDKLSFGGDSLVLLKTTATDLTKQASFLQKDDIKEDTVLTFDAKFMKEDESVVTHTLSFTTALRNADKPADGYTFNELGFGLTKFTYRNTFGEAFKASNRDFKSSITAVATGLKSLFTSGLENMSGPIGIFNMSSSILQNQGFANFLYLWGLISINLALFNLLPFPPLDGWHLLVIAVESITRKEISPKFKQIASLAGAGLLILLTIAILFKDVFTMFGALL